jgi:large subunit ribosomal protein L31e
LDTVKDESLEDASTEQSEEVEKPEETEEITEEEEEKTEEEPTEEAEPTEETETKAEEGEAEAPAVEEEEKEEEKEEREKAPEETEIVEERIYTIPLRRAWIAPRKKRAPRAVRMVKSFVQRHMKIETGVKGEEEEEEERLVLSSEVNEKLWSRGIEKPPRNIRVRAVKDKEGVVTLYLAEGD